MLIIMKNYQGIPLSRVGFLILNFFKKFIPLKKDYKKINLSI